MSNFPTDTLEYKVQEVLNKLINEVSNELYVDSFKRSDEFNTQETRLKTLGVILSKYCEWDGELIKEVALSAFEDSNFSGIEINLD